MTITVGTNSYVTITESNTYLAQSMRAASSGTWTLADATTEKEPALVTATRLLERLTWAGAKTAVQTLSWPRTGVTDRYGSAVDSSTVHQQIKDAQVELAFELLSDPEALEKATDANVRLKRVKAGSVEVEFFTTIFAGKLPSIVWDLIVEFLASSTGTGGVGAALGSAELSGFADTDWTLSRGYA